MSEEASEPTATVMVVDDEVMVARTLESLLQLETNWDVLTFHEPKKALAALENHEIDLVCSDFMMPGMDGITFLRTVRERQPFATRVLLTGYADKTNAIRAINEAGLYHYFEKPWDNHSLKLVIRNGIERARMLRELDGVVKELEGAHRDLRDLRGKLIRAFL